ncbi:MAG: hypothetical protein JKY42_09940 [Flavobacteriales bacterium]|nr:hypothetical protein [Flavobacteriales bacterium]
MKRALSLLLFALFTSMVYAQDVIVKKDGKEIESKIIEVHEDEIHYKRYNNQDGPTYIVNITSLKEVRYENGDIEDYSMVSDTKKERESITYSKPKRAKSDEITVRSGLYYYQGRQISTKKVKQLFAYRNSEEAITMWNRSNMNQGFSYAANIISYPLVILSYFNPLGLIVDPTTAVIISIGGYFVSAGLQVAYYALKTLCADQRIEAVELYNEALKLEQQHSDDDYY